MSYVGNTPALKYVNFAVQHFSTSATASYTLDQSVSNEVEIALFINNVRQEPGSSYAYTATGTALTLSQATAGSDTMYCVFIGKAVETNNPPAGSVNTSELVDNAVTTAKIIDNSITTAKIVNDAVTVDKLNLISTASVPSLEAKGTSGVTEGYIQLNCAENTHGIKIKSPPHSASASYTLTMPTTDGNSSQFLQTNGSGVLTWAEAGGANTPRFLVSKASDQSISQGTTTKVTFDNEVYDEGSCFASNKFTVPANENGTYYLYYNIRINAGAAGIVQYVQAAFYKNNAQLTRTEGLDYRDNKGGYSNNVGRSFAIPLVAGDYIEVYVDQAQSSGTPTVRGEGSGILMSTFGGYKLIT